MVFRGWVLLVVCLLMQAVQPFAASCHARWMNSSDGAGECATASCCCIGDDADGRQACACAESPAPDPSPIPFVPRPTTGERDALTVPMWVEAKPLAGGPFTSPRRESPRPAHRLVDLPTAVTVPLTVRFQVFLI